jgi:hypothetical protein
MNQLIMSEEMRKVSVDRGAKLQERLLEVEGVA